MKPLVKPPRFQDLMDRHGNRLAEIPGRIRGSPLAHGEYLHRDRIRHPDPPDDLFVEEWWLGIKFARLGQYRTTPLEQPGDGPFVYGLPDIVLARLHAIDQRSAGRIETRGDVTTSEARDRYILNSLAEEIRSPDGAKRNPGKPCAGPLLSHKVSCDRFPCLQ